MPTAAVECAQSPHGAPRSANAMSISAERLERLAERARHLTPGRPAGRMVDGVDLVIDGEPAGRMPPRWIEQLEARGYDPTIDGPVLFEVIADRQRGPISPLVATRIAFGSKHGQSPVDLSRWSVATT